MESMRANAEMPHARAARTRADLAQIKVFICQLPPVKASGLLPHVPRLSESRTIRSVHPQNAFDRADLPTSGSALPPETRTVPLFCFASRREHRSSMPEILTTFLRNASEVFVERAYPQMKMALCGRMRRMRKRLSKETLPPFPFLHAHPKISVE